MKKKFFDHLRTGSDPQAEEMYRATITARNGERMKAGVATDGWKMTVDHWVDAAQALLESIVENGFLAQHAIPLDKNYELLNGSHRLAAALSFGIDVYAWKLEEQEVWAPAWGVDWFKDHGLPDADVEKLVRDYEALSEQKSI